MNKKIPTAVFIIIVILAAVGVAAYTVVSEKKVKDWSGNVEAPKTVPEENSECTGLNLEECDLKDDCWAVFGADPKDCWKGQCLSIERFLKCEKRPGAREIKRKAREGMDICKKTGGEWYMVNWNPGKCFCPKNQEFSLESGCK